MQRESSALPNTKRPGKTGKASPLSQVACESPGLFCSKVKFVVKLSDECDQEKVSCGVGESPRYANLSNIC